MNETPNTPYKNRSLLGILTAVVAVLVAIGLWQLDNRVQKLSDKVDKQHKTATEAKESAGQQDQDMVTLTSGKEAFTMLVPVGWGPLIKATGSDFFILGGRVQPTLTNGEKAEITETAGYGSDGPSLFTVRLADTGMSGTPQGMSEEFTIGKGEDALVGKKYSYLYPRDEQIGVGYTRHQNDREYFYTFTTKNGKQLDIVYNVYGSDPRNLVETVDDIVRSIIVK